MTRNSFVTNPVLAAAVQMLSQFILTATVIALAAVTIRMEVESIRNLQQSQSTTTETLPE